MAIKCKIFLIATNISYAVALLVDKHVCTISKDTDIREKKKINFQKKEYKSDHRCEGTNVIAKCKIIMAVTKQIETLPKQMFL